MEKSKKYIQLLLALSEHKYSPSKIILNVRAGLLNLRQ